jgi:hypothetical protein
MEYDDDTDQDPVSIEDGGEKLEFYIAISEDKIVIDFGKPVTWFTFDVDEAEDLVRLLQNRIEIIKQKGMRYGTDTVQ